MNYKIQLLGILPLAERVRQFRGMSNRWTAPKQACFPTGFERITGDLLRASPPSLIPSYTWNQKKCVPLSIKADERVCGSLQVRQVYESQELVCFYHCPARESEWHWWPGQGKTPILVASASANPFSWSGFWQPHWYEQDPGISTSVASDWGISQTRYRQELVLSTTGQGVQSPMLTYEAVPLQMLMQCEACFRLMLKTSA